MAKITIVGLLLLLVSTAAGAQQQPMQGTYQIVAGDVLDIVVWRNKELSMQVTVRPDGWISFPLVSDLRAAGATAVELQKRLEEKLGKFVTTPTVTVVVTRVANLKVSILGKVHQPGRYNLDGPTTVLDVLALAGGLTDYADPDAMYVLRRNGAPDSVYERLPVRYSLSVSGKTNGNFAVIAGDIMIVP